MAFNNWPYTNFQDLNLGWILNKVKEALTKATEALTSTTGFDDRITTAETNSSEANTKATEALATANTANGKATEALSTANNASDTANTASANATQARADATQARADATRALDEVGGAIGSYEIVVTTQNLCYHGTSLIDATDILTAILAGRDVFVIRDDPTVPTLTTSYKLAYYELDNTTNPATTIVYFDRLISYAGENATVERMVVISGSNTATFNTVQTLASKSYVDSHGGGGTTSGAVLYDSVQNLTTAQKAQARDNIGADSRRLILNVTESNGVFSVDKTGSEIRANLHNLALSFGLNEGVYLESYTIAGSPPYHNCVFTVVDPATSAVYYTEFTVSVYYAGYAPSEAEDVATVTRRLITHNINESNPRVQIASDSASIPALSPNMLYVFTGDAAALNITLAAPSNNNVENEYHFIFNSGSTPTTLTLPNTIRQPDGFTIEANHIYEVSILENNMTAQGWAVTP